MNRYIMCAWAAVAACCFFSFELIAKEISGNVVSVADGDTLTVRDENNVSHKIRLAGIDAPEKGQPFANVSKERLAALVKNRPIVVKTDSEDRYGRLLGRVFVLVDVNELLVHEGLAYHYVYYYPNDAGLRAEEAFARKYKSGVWSLPNGGVRPWDFRHSRKSGKLPEVAEPEIADVPETDNADQSAKPLYWVTISSGKVHNSNCKNFKNTRGYLTDSPSGPDCKICGGASKQ
ncbi:MAG: thermonuclease family protein [Opitutales bacterium]|nr:thermonuclease family protein [Opitutales bacterium]